MFLLTQMGVDLLMVTFDSKIDGWKFAPTSRMDGFMPNRAPFCGSMGLSLYPDSAMLEIAWNQEDRSSRILPMPVRLFKFFVVHFVLYHVESPQLLEVEPGGWRRSFHDQLRRSSRHWAGLVLLELSTVSFRWAGLVWNHLSHIWCLSIPQVLGVFKDVTALRKQHPWDWDFDIWWFPLNQHGSSNIKHGMGWWQSSNIKCGSFKILIF